ncbi:MAG: glycerol-3-phosphate 1-O-acyltransferase PlsY [Bryobacteraceae bacterium]|nr:glycerol-3-phosphate 1-O-acyltransferase PlsY [Bryobacteraceae bacterium]
MTVFLVLLAAYAIGGIPFGYIIVRLATGRDIRSSGSGNIGATNVLRTTSRTLGILTLVLDISKGVLAVWLADRFLNGSLLWMSATTLAVMAGHAFPAALRFRGGKAVATFIGAFLYLTPVPLLSILVLFVVAVALSRFISLGSVVAAGLFPLAVWLIDHPPWYVTSAAVLAGAFIVFRHRANLARIREGNENVFTFGGRQH